MTPANPIGELYLWTTQIVGLCVFIVFLWAGLLYLQGKSKEAQQAMKDAVIGTILLFSAYLILEAINPDLVGQTFDMRLPVQEGTTGKVVGGN